MVLQAERIRRKGVRLQDFRPRIEVLAMDFAD